ncbi:MAG: hypothetical protein AB1656_20065 [Candidatus Omnitrophota bacterium]
MISSKPSLRQRMLIVWNRMTSFQKGLFLACCALLPIELGGAAYVASVPEMVELVRSDDMSRLTQITDFLTANNIKFSLSGQNTILVDKVDRNKAALQLAGQGLIGPSFGPGFELFDEARLGMTENMFEMQKQRAMENTLAKAIGEGASNIAVAPVSTKEYEEESITPGIGSQPGVGSNVQDSGLSEEAAITKSKITESIINNR